MRWICWRLFSLPLTDRYITKAFFCGQCSSLDNRASLAFAIDLATGLRWERGKIWPMKRNIPCLPASFFFFSFKNNELEDRYWSAVTLGYHSWLPEKLFIKWKKFFCTHLDRHLVCKRWQKKKEDIFIWLMAFQEMQTIYIYICVTQALLLCIGFIQDVNGDGSPPFSVLCNDDGQKRFFVLLKGNNFCFRGVVIKKSSLDLSYFLLGGHFLD